ncbi:MAG: c-type cytochrome [Pseudomonadota bacterium]
MKKLSAALLLLATTAYAQAYDNSLTEDAIKKRLAPIGSVYLEGDKAAAAAEPTGPRSGEQVYQAACFACHGTGALGAPKSADDWAPRIAKGKDTLLNFVLYSSTFLLDRQVTGVNKIVIYDGVNLATALA